MANNKGALSAPMMHTTGINTHSTGAVTDDHDYHDYNRAVVRRMLLKLNAYDLLDIVLGDN